MRVLHICQRDDPATGGAVRVAAEYVQRLPHYGIDAHCLFLYGPPGPFQVELGHNRAHYLGIKSSGEFLKFGRLLSFLKELQPRIIHHHDALLWPQLLTFFHPGIIKVAHAHLCARRGPFWSKAKVADWSQRQSTDMLICVSEHTLKSQIEQGKYSPAKVQLIYNGVNRQRFYPPTSNERLRARGQLGLPNAPPVVGFVGRLECITKGVDDFLRTISLLPDHFWGLVVGSGPDADFLKELATELGIAERVIFTGLLDNPIVAYHAMDVFCLTSHIEQFPLVVAEAMACSVPVVGFTCEGGMSELLTPETGCVLPNRDPGAMADAVTEVVDHRESWAQRKRNAEAQLRKKQDWEQNTSRLSELYRKLANSAMP
jgi:glycosyltransferase involved in cell wall biosynthesis